jgi:hypothetical protein
MEHAIVAGPHLEGAAKHVGRAVGRDVGLEEAHGEPQRIVGDSEGLGRRLGEAGGRKANHGKDGAEHTEVFHE